MLSGLVVNSVFTDQAALLFFQTIEREAENSMVYCIFYYRL